MTDAEVDQAERECNMADPQYRAGYEDGYDEGAAAERERIKKILDGVFYNWRHSPNHLGLGDVRVTIGMYEGLIGSIQSPSGEE